MKVVCINSVSNIYKGEVFDAYIDKSDILSNKFCERNNAIIELYIYVDGFPTTIAQTMYRHYANDNIKCWTFDYFFRSNFEILIK